jgi:hypothetical protein
MVIYARHGEKYYRLMVSRQWAVKHDNGALISCGLTVGANSSCRESQGMGPYLTERALAGLIRQGKAEEVTQEKYNHSGCHSGCILRGDAACRW